MTTNNFVLTINNITSELEEALDRIQSNPDVTGVILVNNRGELIKSTFDIANSANEYATLVEKLSRNAINVVRDLDPSNDLMFIQMRTKKKEVLVAPDKDFSIIVIQNAPKSPASVITSKLNLKTS